MRSFRGGAFAALALVLLSACALPSDAAAAGSLGGGGGSSPARARRGAPRRVLAADYDAPAKRVPGDYADADADAALWEAARSPPPPSPRAPNPPRAPRPPRRSPPPAPNPPTEAWRAKANGTTLVRNATSEAVTNTATKALSNAATAATTDVGASDDGSRSPSHTEQTDSLSPGESNSTAVRAATLPTNPPAPLSRAEFMAKMEAEWNAIGEGDGGERVAASDDAAAGDAASSSAAVRVTPSARDEDEDGDEDTSDTAKMKAARKKVAVEEGDEGDDELPKAAAESSADSEDSERIESARSSRSDAERPSREDDSTARDSATPSPTRGDDENENENENENDDVASSETAGLSRSVGVDARARELPGDSDASFWRNARNVATGGFAATATLAFLGSIAHVALRSIENARPHSSIELGSSSFKRASLSGVPIRVGGGDASAKARKPAASRKEKEKESLFRSGAASGRPKAPPPGLDLASGGGTALFGDSGSGRRGKKNSRKTTREEDDFYS